MTGYNYNSICEEAEVYLYDYAEGNYGSVPSNISDHITQCKNCKQRLELLERTLLTVNNPDISKVKDRAVILSLLRKHLFYIAKPVACSTVKPFLPSLSRAASGIKVPTPISVHLDHCGQCAKDVETIRCLGLDKKQLEEMALILSEESSMDRRILLDEFENDQNLYKLIEEIADRPDSQIVTTYKIESVDAGSTLPPSEFYSKTRINVKVANAETVVAGDKLSRQIQPKFAFETVLKDFKSLMKPVLAAAAIITIGVMLFHASQAKAVSIREVCKAIEKIKNVYIAKFEAGQTQPIQETWYSENLNNYVIKTANETILWDIFNGKKIVNNSQSGTAETTGLSEDSIVKIKRMTGSYLGLMPFQELSQLPVQSKWVPVEAETNEVSREYEIYDLLWRAENTGGSFQFWKWRFYVDPETNLPRKTECYFKLSGEMDYSLKSVNIIEYPNDGQIADLIKDISF